MKNNPANIKKVAQIMEWLYRNEDIKDKADYREAFSEMILDVFDIEDFQL